MKHTKLHLYGFLLIITMFSCNNASPFLGKWKAQDSLSEYDLIITQEDEAVLVRFDGHDMKFPALIEQGVLKFQTTKYEHFYIDDKGDLMWRGNAYKKVDSR